MSVRTQIIAFCTAEIDLELTGISSSLDNRNIQWLVIIFLSIIAPMQFLDQHIQSSFYAAGKNIRYAWLSAPFNTLVTYHNSSFTNSLFARAFAQSPIEINRVNQMIPF